MEQTGDGFLELPASDAVDPTLDWPVVFGNNQPVEVELGIGKGRFLLNAAERLPDVNFVGVEWAAKYLRIAQHRAVKRKLHNVRLVRTDAREFVEFFISSRSIKAYHIYFPDPWPKKRHHKRRLFSEGFLREVERTLQEGGRLWLATDFAEYFAAMLDVLATSECLEEIDDEWLGAKTNYEEKYLAQGKPIYRRVLQKISD